MTEISREMFRRAVSVAPVGAPTVKKILEAAGITVAEEPISPAALRVTMREVIESYVDGNRANNASMGREGDTADAFYPDDVMWMLDDAIREVQRG